MKLSIKTKEIRVQEKLLRERKWHTHFALKPIRLDDNSIVWLERVLRRREWDNGDWEWVYKESVFDLLRDGKQ